MYIYIFIYIIFYYIKLNKLLTKSHIFIKKKCIFTKRSVGNTLTYICNDIGSCMGNTVKNKKHHITVLNFLTSY